MRLISNVIKKERNENSIVDSLTFNLQLTSPSNSPHNFKLWRLPRIKIQRMEKNTNKTNIFPSSKWIFSPCQGEIWNQEEMGYEE